MAASCILHCLPTELTPPPALNGTVTGIGNLIATVQWSCSYVHDCSLTYPSAGTWVGHLLWLSLHLQRVAMSNGATAPTQVAAAQLCGGLDTGLYRGLWGLRWYTVYAKRYFAQGAQKPSGIPWCRHIWHTRDGFRRILRKTILTPKPTVPTSTYTTWAHMYIYIYMQINI